MLNLSSRKSRTALVALTTAIIVAVGAIAFAYWTSSGEGTGTGSTGTSTALEVAGTGITGDPLIPGGPEQVVAFTVTNPSEGAQTLSDVAVTVAMPGGAAWTSGACSAADYTLGTPDVAYGEIAAGGTVDGTVTLEMNNLATSQDDCKGVTVALRFVAS